ncbi:PEP/pyruvate-binding domain-containing protein [Myxococcota bacterium]|nr:PEP/pyruvate-binding domain-containing protein [Myxococcota bacterium]
MKTSLEHPVRSDRVRSFAVSFAVSCLVAAAVAGCGGGEAAGPIVLVEGACSITAGGDAPDSLSAIPCLADFEALASEPLDTSIPGARSVKVVLDQLGGDALHFQNSQKYQIHYEFASAHLSGGSLPFVGSLSEFNTTEYYSPDRRFVLGSVTYHAQPDLWVLEIAPYDTASVAMIEKLHAAVAKAGYFGPALAFHPTSTAVAATAAALPASISVATTDDIYAGIDYQPLNLAAAMGRLRFLTAAELATTYVSFRDIVVLDVVPNDISVVSGIITEEFQTPLSHINVLSQNRRTPNMGLKGATSSPELRALDGAWVELDVGALAWSVRAVTVAEADAWWDAHKPEPVVLPDVDFTVRDLRDIEDVTIEEGTTLREALKTAVAAFGGKAAHYSILAKTEGVPVRKAFAIPAIYYWEHMEANGLWARFDAMVADPEFQQKAEVRDEKLRALRDAIESATVAQELQDLVRAKMESDYPGLTMRFRSSTNSEDLDGFPCAGCYESHTGDPADWEDVLDAIRETWASIWLFRTYEERAYNGIDHRSVVMALLVHHNFPDEEANGVALTSNPYDPTGLQPGFYVNVQWGGTAEVVHPPPGVTSDQYIHLFDQPGQPVIYLSHSNLVTPGATVLSPAQVLELGRALDAIHTRFNPAYGPASGNDGWYAMDVEFKFDGDPGETPRLVVKQARPNPGRGE